MMSDRAEYQVGSPPPPANDGATGSIFHWELVKRIHDMLERRGYRDLRVDQQQVAQQGGRRIIVGENRPDVQGERRGRRVNVEVDTSAADSDQHQRIITANDPKARGVYVVIHPTTGRIVELRHYNPRTRSTISVRRPVATRTRAGAGARTRKP